jgi:large subunit ribosomal protein L21
MNMAEETQAHAARGKAAPSTYAIVESGGKQYRAEKGSTLVVDRLKADEGEKVNLRAVMFRNDGDTVLDAGKLEKVKVEAVIAGHERGSKIRVFKYRAKKGYRRRAGHRSELTRLEVTEVALLTRKPAAKKPAAKKPAAKKPAAKKTSTAKKTPPAKKTPTQKKES